MESTQHVKLYNKFMRAREALGEQGALLPALGADVGALLCAPLDPASLSSTELDTLVERALRPLRPSSALRTLWGAHRAPGESLQRWAHRVQRLAEPCGLGAERHAVVRHVFLLGLDHAGLLLDLDDVDQDPVLSGAGVHVPTAASEPSALSVTRQLQEVKNNKSEIGTQYNVSGKLINNYNNAASHVPKCPLPYELPRQQATFLGRETETLAVDAALRASGRRGVVLHGFAGVGKSQLAVHYARTRLRHYQDNVVWLHSTPGQLEAEFRKMVRELDVLEADRPVRQVVRNFYNALKDKGNSLIIFDDVLSEDDIEQYLPDTPDINVDILITSPQSCWTDFDKVSVQPFSRDVTETVLKCDSRTKINFDKQTRNNWEELLTILDGMPLAIHSTILYLSKNQHLVEDFKSDSSFYKTMSEAIDKSLCFIKKYLVDKNLIKIMDDVLNCCAYLHHSNIQVPLLLQLCQLLSENDKETTQKDFEKVKTKLCEFSFITEKKENIQINRLVQRVFQMRLNCSEKSTYKVLLEFSINHNSDDSTWMMHKECILSAADSVVQTVLQMYNAGNYQYQQKLLIFLIENGCTSVLKYIFESMPRSMLFGKSYLINKSKFLHTAIAWNQASVVQSLLRYGADVNKVDEEDMNPLMIAATRGLEDIARLLISRGAQVDKAGPRDNTPLHVAAKHGHVGVCQVLLDKQCSEEARNSDGQCAVHVAAKQGQLEVVEVLVGRNPASATWTTPDENTPLHLAAQHGHAGVCQVLLDNHCSEEARNSDGQCAVHVAAQQGQLEVVKVLVGRNPASATWTTPDENTPLHLAAQHGHAGVCQVLLDNHCSEEARNKDGQCAVHVAAEQGQLEVIEVLVGRNPASATWTVRDDDSPLHLAARAGHVHVLRYFLAECGVVVDTLGQGGRTALMLAAHGGHTEAVRWLLERGASPRTRATWSKYSALHHASIGGNADTAQLLIDSGSEVDALDKDNWTPLYLAAINGHLSVARVLIAAQADVNVQDVGGYTPLHRAAWRGHLDVVGLLCDAGAAGDMRNNWGLTPLREASGQDICAFLRERFPGVTE